jgi:putative alpha-1,2-mannosidase
MDQKIHHLVPGQRAQYANFSGWDVYRSQLQLVTWLDPQAGSDIAQSLLNGCSPLMID